MSFEESASAKAKATPATTMPASRSYPVEPERAREVAIARIRYRYPKHERERMPSEYEIWREHEMFPDVLGAYAGPCARFRSQHADWLEAEDVRIYGDVRDETAGKADALRAAPHPEPPYEPWPRTAAERDRIIADLIDRSLRDGYSEDSGRVRAWRRMRDRIAGRSTPAKATRGGDPTSLADELVGGIA